VPDSWLHQLARFWRDPLSCHQEHKKFSFWYPPAVGVNTEGSAEGDNVSERLDKPSRQDQIAKYLALCRRAGQSEDVRLLDEWRLPNCAEKFDLDAFGSYLEANGDALGELTSEPFPSRSR